MFIFIIFLFVCFTPVSETKKGEKISKTGKAAVTFIAIDGLWGLIKKKKKIYN